MSPRIVVVGGGSTHWTPKLALDMANTAALTDTELVLMDVDEASLPPMLELVKHVATVRGIGLSATATTDLDRALDGAEFVVTALSVGGFASMRHDVEIPARYGIRQPVGDSVGPGGVMRALRSVPVVLDVARRMERRCPGALLLNVSNPLSALCRAVTRETSVATVGLCNELVGLKFVLSLLFDADMRTIDPVVGGVNHLPLVTSLGIGGGDGFAMLADVLAHQDDLAFSTIWMAPPEGMHYRKVTSGEEWTKADLLANNRIKLELFSQFGVLPGSSDTHVAEFFPWFVTPDTDFGREWGVHHYGMAGHQADKAEDERFVAEVMSSEEISRWASGELVAAIVEGVLTGGSDPLPVNLPNTGQVASLPPGVVVECIGVADGSGVRARDQVTVPSILGECLRRVALAEELTVEAALTANPTTVLEAMLADPLAGALPFEKVVAMRDEMLAATAAWLPGFAWR
jgi:alpha-galactosidase